MGRMTEVRVPDIGDFDKVDVIEVLVAAGDRVEMEQSLITLESDKATMEIPSPAAGVVRELRVAVGDKIGEGAVILALDADEAGAGEADPAPAAKKPAPQKSEPVSAPPPAPAPASQAAPKTPAPGDAPRKPAPMPAYTPVGNPGKSHAGPAVRRFARELGVDLSRVEGSGPKGRILKDDVQNWVKTTLAQPAASGATALAIEPPPEIDFSKFGPIDTVELSRIQKKSGPHLHRSWVSVPHVTQFDEADITELEEFRQKSKKDAETTGVKLTFLPFLMKACVSALRKYPAVNASLSADGEHLILKKYIHLGIAVDTPDGLVVPVVRDVDRKGLYELAREVADVSERVRAGKLTPRDLQGASFTISSLGGIGGTNFTPIVNAPEVAILGVARASMKPVWNGSEFEPRLMMPFSLSYDHRVVDGALGARFTTYLAAVLSDIRRSLL
ncbi:MAG: dihydrolipoyllysine-residue acetyltransferase [Chromatiales bacterium]|nr:dihydrolipoyllysine-residue acetyltransferase [Chromatiales bacterium]